MAGAREIGQLDRGTSAQSRRAEPISSFGGMRARAAFVPRGVRLHGSVDSSVGWLTGPGDGPKGPPPRVVHHLNLRVQPTN
jgi:hypothetical protein